MISAVCRTETEQYEGDISSSHPAGLLYRLGLGSLLFDVPTMPKDSISIIDVVLAI